MVFSRCSELSALVESVQATSKHWQKVIFACENVVEDCLSHRKERLLLLVKTAEFLGISNISISIWTSSKKKEWVNAFKKLIDTAVLLNWHHLHAGNCAEHWHDDDAFPVWNLIQMQPELVDQRIGKCSFFATTLITNASFSTTRVLPLAKNVEKLTTTSLPLLWCRRNKEGDDCELHVDAMLTIDCVHCCNDC